MEYITVAIALIGIAACLCKAQIEKEREDTKRMREDEITRRIALRLGRTIPD